MIGNHLVFLLALPRFCLVTLSLDCLLHRCLSSCPGIVYRIQPGPRLLGGRAWRERRGGPWEGEGWASQGPGSSLITRMFTKGLLCAPHCRSTGETTVTRSRNPCCHTASTNDLAYSMMTDKTQGPSGM